VRERERERERERVIEREGNVVMRGGVCYGKSAGAIYFARELMLFMQEGGVGQYKSTVRNLVPERGKFS